MKDRKDTQTADIFTGKTGAGRPRKWASNADKMRAYRLRVKAIKRQAIS